MWRPIAMTIGLLAAMVAAVAFVDPLGDAASDAVSGETASLRQDLRGLGAGGVALIAALAALHTFVWYPAEILDAAAGYVYGFWPALAILIVCWTAQAMVAYEIGKRAARPILNRHIDPGRCNRVDHALAARGVTVWPDARVGP